MSFYSEIVSNHKIHNDIPIEHLSLSHTVITAPDLIIITMVLYMLSVHVLSLFSTLSFVLGKVLSCT